MNGKSFSRLESSQAIDELLSLSDRRQPPNWLLTYLDVFVLIVMLVVTLVALSTFEPDVRSNEKPTKIVIIKKTIKPAKKAEPAPVVPAEPAVAPPPAKPQQPIQVETEPTVAPEKTPIATKPAATIQTTENTPLPEQEQAAESKTEPKDEAAMQQQLHSQLQQLGLSDSINMTVTQGYAQLEIQDNILYQSSEATLTETGRSVLSKLTPLLKQAKGLIYIEGHTDNRPIKTAQFPSNWELGAARATSVLHFLASQQIDASRMRAVTYADTQPIADNATEPGRRKNRRVNIVVKMPDNTNVPYKTE
ncbi:OmpA family protein [Methylomarinum sp. Ch1-1]|uniref:OmpA family protein n=1 Tax=Methylomarinum roseum TaxID=3067653 RepID=A0AAU7NUX4_9GAMM|nr:OmpA family protein [Methylomarinum sp. Ch1-1]MDP4519472.1 OmpA family protein [Methylomarinum sp. Ch1-1]